MNLIIIPKEWLIDLVLLFIAHADGLPSAFREVVGYVIGISTGLAIVAAAICLLRIMFAEETNQVAEAKGDIKVVAIAWLAINSLWAIVNFILNLVNTVKL